MPVIRAGIDGFDSFTVDALALNDTITVLSNTGPTTLRGGDGSDNLSVNATKWDALLGPVTLDGGLAANSIGVSLSSSTASIPVTLSNRQVTVGGPYFKESTAPLFLILLLLMGIGPLLPWRRATGRRVRERLALPAAGGAGVMVLLAALGMRDLAAVAALGLAAFVAAANATTTAVSPVFNIFA